MTLAYPWWLLLALLLPALLWLRYHPGRRPAVAFSDGEALRHLPRSWAVRAQPLLPLLFGLGLLLLVIALARPQRGLSESRVETEAVDIVLLVDVSTSMRAEDFATPLQEHLNRLDAAKTVLNKFILDRPDDPLGMIAFSAMPYTVSPLTMDHAWLIKRMEDLKTGMLEDGTAIGDALASAVNRLRDGKATNKVVVLLTDGQNNAGAITPANAAQLARAMRIKVYCVGAGASGMVRVPVLDFFGQTQYARQMSEIDEPTLKNISRVTGGRYFRAQNLDELETVYEEIDKLEKTRIEVEQYTRYEERFMSFLALGLALLLAEKLLALTRLGRLP